MQEKVNGLLTEPGKIWNIAFIGIFLANTSINMGQYMINSLLAVYANSLGAPATTIGILMSMFAIAAACLRIVSAPAMDTYNRKYIVVGAMLVLASAYFGYSLSGSISSLMAFRLLQGCGMAFGNACCLAMVAETLPKEKYGVGIGYFSLAQVASQAIGPTIGLWLASLVGYRMTFAINALVLLLGALLASRIRYKFKRTKKLKISFNNIIAREALLPAFVLLFLIMVFGAVGSFLIIFAEKQGVTENIGLFFTVTALTMLFTRPLVGKLTDKYGLVKVLIPSLFTDVIALYIISVSHTLIMFLMAAFISAFGFGACQPALQTLSMKCVPNERRGAGSTTNYLGMDFGALLGPLVAGAIVQTFGYVAMWRAMVIPLFISMLLVFVFREKIAAIEEHFMEGQAAGS